MAEKHKCPVCGEYEFKRHNSFEDCLVCGWVDDAVQAKDPGRKGCANGMSVKEAKEAYKNGQKVY